MSSLEFEGFGLSHGGATVLQGLDLKIERGQAYGIVGATRTGKSALALAIAGLSPKDSAQTGAIRFDGQPLPSSAVAMARVRGRRIGFLFGDGRARLGAVRTISQQLENVVATSDGVSQEPEKLLTAVNLTSRADAYPHDLNEEERRLAMLALMLAAKPELVVADEPTLGLDSVAARRVLDSLSRARRDHGFTLLVLTRDYRVAVATCDQAAVLLDGSLVARGNVNDLFARPQHDHTRDLVSASKIRIRTLTRPPIGTNLLSVKDLAFERSAPDREPSGISFVLRRFESLAIVARAGSGKTRMARIVAGLEQARAGTLMLDRDTYRGADLPRDRRREVAFVANDPARTFNPRLAVGTSITEPLRLEAQLLMDEQADRMVEIVRAVGCDPQTLTGRPNSFSTDALHRLALARALIAKPRLVVLDEPAAGLDPLQRSDLLMLLARLRSDYGLSYLILTRDLEAALALADRALILDQGSIVEEGRPSEIIDAPTSSAARSMVEARLGDPGIGPGPSPDAPTAPLSS